MTSPTALLHQTYWFAGLTLAAAILAFIFRRWARRGRTIGDQPHCRACHYNLFGLEPTSTRCPECGADLEAKNAKTIGAPRRRPVLFVLMLGCFAMTGIIGYKATRVGRWAMSYEMNQPTWWLMRQLTSADHERAWGEVQRRFESNELTDDQLRTIAQAILELHTTPNSNFSIELGYLLDSMHDKGKVSDEQWLRYWRQAIVASHRESRPNVRRGDPLPLRVTIEGRNFFYLQAAFSHSNSLKAININGKPLNLTRQSLAKYDSGIPRNVAESEEDLQQLLIDAEWLLGQHLNDGPQTIQLVFEISVFTGGARSSKKPELMLKFDLTCECKWNLVSPDALTMSLSHPPTLEQKMRKLTEAVRVIARPDKGSSAVRLIMNGSDRDLPFAMSIHLRTGGTEWSFAKAVSGRDRSASFDESRRLDDFHATKADIIFRPDPDEARRTVDITEIYDREIVIKEVPIEWADPQGRPWTISIPENSTPHPPVGDKK